MRRQRFAAERSRRAQAKALCRQVVTVHLGADGDATIVDQRDLSDDNNAVVTYHNLA